MPNNWKNVSVYDLADYINGAAFKKNEYADTGLPIIKIAELKNELRIPLNIAVSRKMKNIILMTEIYCFLGQVILIHQ